MRQLRPNTVIHINFEDLPKTLNFLRIKDCITIWR